MFDRLKKLFDDDDGAAPARGGRAVNELQLAAAAVLVEAARRDDDYDLSERRVIEGLLRERFSLSAEEAERLIEAADAVTDHGVELYTYTRQIKDAFDEDER
ncbi:MAG: TerB family tellurite resistance protein, partial [Alphaproteobacteria bacterium]